MLKDLVDGLTSLVYPPQCMLCRQMPRALSPSGLVCPSCAAKISSNHPPFCLKCMRHLRNIGRPVCTNCCDRPIYFDFAWSSSLFEEPLKELIHRFKYYQKTLLRHFFGELMASFIREYHLDIGQFDWVAPIPLHPSKLRERGFNQSLLLAEQLCRNFDKKLRPDVLLKVRQTKNQAELSQKERWTNMEGAFRIKRSEKVSGKNILLIDDLLTTGATASEAARALKENGAQKVAVYTLAVAL